MNQAGMNQDIPEDLSAGIDGELSKEQLRFLLRRLDHDASLRSAWARHHVARDSLRGELPVLASAGFSARVMSAIEQGSQSAATARRNHWLRWSAGGAIAASVAAAALMVAQPVGDAGQVTASAPQQSSNSEVALATPVRHQPATSPAAVPPWLSGNAAGMLSQQASATLGAPFEQGRSTYGRLPSYSTMHRYRTLDNNDGTYLLLLDPQQQRVSDSARRTGAGAR